MLKTIVNATVLSLVLAMPAHAFGLKSLAGDSGALDAVSSLGALSSLGDLSGLSDNPLVSTLTSKTDTSTAESAAGSGLLLALAGSTLNSEQSSELSGLIPGYSQLTDLVPSGTSLDSLNSVMSAADTLGIDKSTITKYIPTILEFVSKQGGSSGLMDSLSSLWGAK